MAAVSNSGRPPPVPPGGTDEPLLDPAGEAEARELLELSRLAPAAALSRLGSGAYGLSEPEAAARLTEYGVNRLPAPAGRGWPARLAAAARNPFLALLVLLDVLLAASREPLGAALVSTVVLAGVALRLAHEYRIDSLAARLATLATPRVTVLRRTRHGAGPVARACNPRLLVPGDLVELGHGDVVPADCRVVWAENFSLDQSALTGQSTPAPKRVLEPVRPAGPDRRAGVLSSRTLCLTGAAVATGRATVVVVKTGHRTVLGGTARVLCAPRRPTAADLCLRAVTGLLLAGLCLLVPAALGLTRLAQRGTGDGYAWVFAVAVAVGLVPQLLPVVLTAVHGRALTALDRAGIMLCRPAAVQDLAGVDVLCVDKTGTLTTGRARLHRWVGPDGGTGTEALEYAVLHAVFRARDRDALATAVLAHASGLDQELAAARYTRLGGTGTGSAAGPRYTSVLLASGAGRPLLVTVGAPDAVLRNCTGLRRGGAVRPLGVPARRAAQGLCRALWRDGCRVRAVAYREVDQLGRVPELEHDLVLAGFVAFEDPLRPEAPAAVAELARRGVRAVVLTGDDPGVAAACAQAAGLAPGRPVTGVEIERLSPAQLAWLAARTGVFAQLDPVHKARIVRALRSAGHTVGYLGDGVNDTLALRAADVALVPARAAAVALAAADVVLRGPGLDLLATGVDIARRGTLNATKYLKATLSANLGNVLSVLAASFVPFAAPAWPFLPMLPAQLLVGNIGLDLAQLALPLDRVEPAQLARPHRWSVPDLVRFAACFGPLSTGFDLLLFRLLGLAAPGTGWPAPLFGTLWFLDSLATGVLAVLVLRTEAVPLWRGRPTWPVALAVLGTLAAGAALPYTPAGARLGLVPVPARLVLLLVPAVAAYLVTLHLAARLYRRVTGRWL